MLPATTTLSIVSLVTYLILLPFTAYVTHLHRHPLTLGYPFILLFLLIQIVGEALVIHASPAPSIAGLIITGIGLSPQLLGLAGILHEILDHTVLSRKGKGRAQRKKMGWAGALLYHVLILTAVPIYAVGLSEKASGDSAPDAESLTKVGMALLLLAWLVLAAATVAVAMFVFERDSHGVDCRGLYWSVVVAVALVGMRVIYQAVATFSGDLKYAPVVGDVIYPGVLQFMPSALVVISLIVGGLMSGRPKQGSATRV